MKVNLEELRKREEQGLIKSQVNGQGLTIWTYTNLCQFDRAWDEYTMMARGLVTNEEGKVITRPFPKFFNLHEREETLAENLPKIDYQATPKLDGSLLCITLHEGQLLITTKGSFDNIYISEAKRVLRTGSLQSLWRYISKGNVTLCCEVVIDPKIDTMRRVVEHPVGIYFLAAFDNDTGEEIIDFLNLDTEFALESFGIKIPTISKEDIEYLLKHGRDDKGHEGWVIRFNNGFRVKVKTFWYLCLFRFINNVDDEHIKEYMINNPDNNDWMQAIPEELREEVEELVKNINMRYDREYKRILEEFHKVKENSETRKDFALQVKDNPRAWFFFLLYDGKDIREKLLKVV